MDILARRRDRARRIFDKNNPFAEWYAGKEFTQDWAMGSVLGWRNLLSGSEGQIRDILEIGSHEGRSAIFWLRHLPHSHVTCVDPWAESDVPSSGDVGVEGRFNRNLSPFADRLRKMKMKSLQAFAMLGDEGRSFDLIYIDGDHRRDAVMLDCLLSWQAVRPGGMLLFDDYVFHMTEDRHRPQIAIDTFLAWHPEASVLLKSGQIAFQKPSPYAAPPSPV